MVSYVLEHIHSMLKKMKGYVYLHACSYISSCIAGHNNLRLLLHIPYSRKI